MNDPLQHQEGGNHYKDMKIQPVEFITANQLTYLEGCVIKYISRHRKKGGVEDLKKATHYTNLIIQLEYPPVTVETKNEAGEVVATSHKVEWHNPHNLTPEQVGEGYRLITTEERAKRERMGYVEWGCEIWYSDGVWLKGYHGNGISSTYRVPISTPINA